MKKTRGVVRALRESRLDPAPYARWPSQMRKDVGADFRDLQFTFYFDVE
jgi:hypothetical protein